MLVGYDLTTDVVPDPPASGEAIVDADLADLVDVEVGDTLAIGPEGQELVVAAVVADISQGSPTIWVATDDWLDIAATVNPTERPATQAAVVAGNVDPDDLAAACCARRSTGAGWPRSWSPTTTVSPTSATASSARSTGT